MTTTPPLEDDVKPIRDALYEWRHCHPSGIVRALGNFNAAANPERIARLLAHIDAQAVRLDAAERDAGRYRWLRDGQESDWAICEWADDHDGTGFYRDARNAEIVEAAIDAAMASEIEREVLAAIASEAKP